MTHLTVNVKDPSTYILNFIKYILVECKSTNGEISKSLTIYLIEIEVMSIRDILTIIYHRYSIFISDHHVLSFSKA